MSSRQVRAFRKQAQQAWLQFYTNFGQMPLWPRMQLAWAIVTRNRVRPKFTRMFK